MKNLASLMKQATQMQAKMEAMQSTLEGISIEGAAGAGMVTVVLSGKGDMRSIKIDPSLADPAEMEMLQDLIVAACADARRKLDERAAEEMQKVTGGLNLPAGLKLPF
ncbi:MULTISPECIES: YbaB/EbfC family nucleoid-associated protein [Acetobacter]|jgi:DNA-binding YbaB/EbfC family protein|uniref:Nucleoid-associated protein APE01nite_13380 n=1 Tax=Acetobacter peroxydans TaxID=104098 RepID=A0A4Y3TR86_9PROT|nr:YbaB/EbfC family nucleoid-associated protein [Acetobacter peroxydans]MCH4092760.1 YbaB/EbfC family nucleoid-associated protein [Acetobacter peroxydans]MCH4143296.1 YbaB/EbfC family nucleoid-associated protein [Acetobacter peroxydans]MCI1394214.1 YbaB/EbfC family nucleoid-associated protein [Acetobacter peroxydans]MCI1411824.1 YbaB/EbfC family nucleoid-associated protein [Acetobacter peroxydans]MCI1439949.1 YbaB/EbfC family nucleoid-associated protein [Acetobacter peroxydans]